MNLFRKRLNIVLGLVLLLAISYGFWSLIVGGEQMEEFCKSLVVGSSANEIEKQVVERGYGITARIDGPRIVHETRSFGGFTCFVEFEKDKLVSSKYVFND